MSLKRILGTVLASQMAGRGRSRGSLGGSALGGLGHRRRSAPGGKAGLAALGFMAFRAYQDHESRNVGRPQTLGSGTGSTGGGLGGLVQSLTDRLGGGTSTGSESAATTSDSVRQDQQSGQQDRQDDERAAEALSDETALLLIRAMVTAAHADGSMSPEERERILQDVQDGDDDENDRRTMEREVENPKPLDELLAQVGDQETAEQFYLASRAAVDAETDANRAYLSDLRQRLSLSDQQVAEIEEFAA